MTKDEIIEMPEYLNAAYEGDDLYTGDQVRELMKLVAADAAAKEREKWEGQTEVEIHEAVLEEREACAMICDKASAASLPAFLAIQIRARGQV